MSHSQIIRKSGNREYAPVDVIAPVITEGILPILFILKKDGTICFFVDYRKRNVLRMRVPYHIQRRDECIYLFGNSTRFPTSDVRIGYWQIEIAEWDRYKTALTSHQACSALPKFHLS